jgi:leader peptidase (prepilin peptidase) / N-methyltransferase
VGTMEAVGISFAAGTWAGVVGWRFRAGSLPRRWVEEAGVTWPLAGTPATSSALCEPRVWPAITAAAAASVAAALTLGRKGSLWLLPFLVIWANGLALLALIDQETLLLPSKVIHTCVLVVVCLLLVDGVATGNSRYLGQGLACGLAALTVFGLWALWRPNRLGFGDARFAALVAVGAGALSPAGCVAALACAPAAAAAISTLRRHYRGSPPKTPIALGPFLALAGITAVVASAI